MNHHGDVMALIDDSGSNIVARYEYDPWGVLLSATGPAVDACPFRWQTKYIDAETGLYYFGYRFFDSLTGRWLSRDPLEEDGGVNLYAFCGNDPVNGVDPLGLRPRVTTWLRSGFVYWDVDDMPDNVRDQVYSTDYTEEGWFSTRAGTHAIIGCLGIFESIGHLVYDAGRAAGGSVDDENVWLGLMNATIDEGPAYVAKEMLFAPYNAITSGDAEQAGGAVFGLYIFSRQAHASGKGYLKARGEGAGNWTAVKAAMRSKTEPIRLRRPAATPPRVGPTVENAKSIAAENIVSIDQLNASHFSSEYGEAVFYAGRGKLNRLAANASGGTTIGSTAGGQALDRIVDWESMSMQESRAFAAPYSEMFAEQASGPIRSWAGGASLESVWRQTELPALLRNLKVTKITILDAARPEITRIIYPKR
jgi:RHS repeat-associated protein